MVANEKGYSESSWFILGFLFSFPALDLQLIAKVVSS